MGHLSLLTGRLVLREPGSEMISASCRVLCDAVNPGVFQERDSGFVGFLEWVMVS